MTQSQASLRQNQVNLAHTVIESPIDGLVISRNVDVGQTVAASMSAPTLFVLAADLTKMQVLASLDESDVGRIRPGQAVRFRVDAFPTDEFTGSVTQVRLQPTTVQNVVTYQTVIDVPNPGLKLKPGMTANVNIEIARRTNVLRVPNGALRFRPTAETFAALGQTPPPGGTGGGGADVAPAAVPTHAMRSRRQRPPRSSRWRSSSRPFNSGPRRNSAQPCKPRSKAKHHKRLHRRRLGTADGAWRRWRRRTPRRTRQFRRAHGQHDSRRARAFHGAHARTRLHASGRRSDGCRGASPRRAGVRDRASRARHRLRSPQPSPASGIGRDDVRRAVRPSDADRDHSGRSG